MEDRVPDVLKKENLKRGDEYLEDNDVKDSYEDGEPAPVAWKRPNMRGSKCSINGYVRLGIVKTIIIDLRSVGDDVIREFRESCLGHFIREEWGGFVSNAALHALFSNEVVRPDAQAYEFWFRIGHRSIRFSRYEYALVTGLRFGDSDFDVHGDDVPPTGSVYDRYPFLIRGVQMLDRIRDRFADGYFRAQPGDALKVAKVLCVCYLMFGMDGKRIAERWLWTLVEDQTRWESFPWGLYSYQILVTYLSNVPTEIPAGPDPSYHFYGNIYAIMIWACEAIPSLGAICGIRLGASYIQRPRCIRWKLKKLGYVDFTTFFDQEYVHRMAICKKGRGKGRGRPRDDDDDSAGGPTRERIIRQRTSRLVTFQPEDSTSGHEPSGGPHERIPTDLQCQGPPTRDTHQTAPITDLDTLFTRLCAYIDSAFDRVVEQVRLYKQ